jgi:hypothetical protein
MHEPQPYPGNDRHRDIGERGDPGHGRVGGEPDDPRGYRDPDAECEADPLLPLGKSASVNSITK